MFLEIPDKLPTMVPNGQAVPFPGTKRRTEEKGWRLQKIKETFGGGMS